MKNPVNVVFEEGQLENLKSVSYALTTLHSVPEFQRDLSAATFDGPLTIDLTSRFGSRYVSESNTVYLDFREIAGTLYNTGSGGVQRTSLQEVIVHEVRHAAQKYRSSTDIADFLFEAGIFSGFLLKNNLEPDAISFTNHIRSEYLDIEQRVGHAAIGNLALADAGEVLVYGGLTADGTPLIISPSDIPCLLYTSPSPRDQRGSRMPSSA